MGPLSRCAASAYRKIDLDARVEASTGEDLTLICLEEVVSTLGQALIALERMPNQPPNDLLARAHAIALWLARGVAPDNPLRTALVQFYGGLAATIARSRTEPKPAELARVRGDFADILGAARAA